MGWNSWKAKGAGVRRKLDGPKCEERRFHNNISVLQRAIDYVSTIQQPKIVLVDGELLAKLMIDHGIGVADVATYTVKKVDLITSKMNRKNDILFGF